MKSKVVILTILILVFSSAVHALQLEDRAMKRGLRPMSMGGAFTAVSDDENAFFYNPAGITIHRDSYFLQVFSIDAAITTSSFDFYDFYKANENDFNKFSNLTPDQKRDLIERVLNKALGFNPNIFVSLPNIAFISSSVPFKENYLNVGLGFFSYASAEAKFNRGVIIPSIVYNLDITGVGILPVAFKINSLERIKMPGSLSLGASLKYMYRRRNSRSNLSIDEMQDYSFDNQWLYGTSFGMDIGAIYHINSCCNIGLNIVDIYNSGIDYKNVGLGADKYRSAEEYSVGINPELNLGIAYYPKKIYYWPGKFLNTNNNLVLAFDLTDLANSKETVIETPFKKTHFGAEYKYNPFVLRFGFNSGYPTVSCGIGTNIMQLEYAFYGEERGMYAGQDPVWFHRILLSVKLGHSKEKNAAKRE
jgi:hypothetical protein